MASVDSAKRGGVSAAGSTCLSGAKEALGLEKFVGNRVVLWCQRQEKYLSLLSWSRSCPDICQCASYVRWLKDSTTVVIPRSPG